MNYIAVLISLIFKIAGKLRMTALLIYLFLIATVLRDWIAIHQIAGYAIFCFLILLWIGNWISSALRFFCSER